MRATFKKNRERLEKLPKKTKKKKNWSENLGKLFIWDFQYLTKKNYRKKNEGYHISKEIM